ncbi:hypothetical protein N7582_003484 [Saccharomyces uvarum]|nr:hypothetical protein N7582_003484 [Saccharomyces uvarum]
MEMPPRQIIPTLMPEWTPSPEHSYMAADDSTSPPITPTSQVSSFDSSLSQMKPTYSTIIEENIDTILDKIRPFVKKITASEQNKKTINQYTLGVSAGSGQFGHVRKAYSSTSNKVVAIKIIPKKPWNAQQYSMNQVMRQIQLWKSKGKITTNMSGNEAMRLMNIEKCRWEIYAVSRLRDSVHVVRLIECLDSPFSESIWIVSDWCNLGELQWKRDNNEDILPQWERLVPSKCSVSKFAKKILQDMTRGLEYLYSQGCIHRDIKPSNILLDEVENVAKISDLGCCIFTPQSLPFKNANFEECFQRELNKIVGTPAFIAPELCHLNNSKRDFVTDGFKLDIWSLGVTLYCLLYNELPFSGDNEFDTYHKIMEVPLSSKVNGSSLNDLIIKRLLEKDVTLRIGIQDLAKIILPDQIDQPEHSKDIDQSILSKVKPTRSEGPVRRFFDKLMTKKSKKKVPENVKDNAFGSANSKVTPPVYIDADPQKETFSSTVLRSSPDSSDYCSSLEEEAVQVTDFLDTFCDSNGSLNNLNVKNDKRNTEMKIEKSNSSSHSSFKIPTPIKALIRLKNSPVENRNKSYDNRSSDGLNSPSKNSAKEKHRVYNPEPKKLAHSGNIINFKAYINSADNDRQETVEDVRTYLNFADNGQA